MKRTTLALAGAAAVLLAVAGCAADGTERTMVDGGHILAVVVETPDGRNVTCVVGSSGKGIDCDWENAR